VHPVDQRHKRIQALLKFSRNVMKRTWLPNHERDEMIDNYCRTHWALGQTSIRDYRKTVLIAIQSDIENAIDRQLLNLRVADTPPVLN